MNFTRFSVKIFFLLTIIFLNLNISIYSQTSYIELTAVGDILPGDEADTLLKEKGYDYIFDSTRYILKNTDILIGNLKSSLSTKKGQPLLKSRNTFYACDPVSIKSLLNAGFDVISLASNHFGDYGYESMLETFNLFNNNNLIYIGAGKNLKDARSLKIIKIKNTRIGFLSYSDKGPPEFYADSTSPGVMPLIMDYFKSDIENAKKDVDILVVSVHWGDPYTNLPNNKQVITARNMIDYGADIILGHYPHTLQGIEIYNSGIIAYSLGTFSFGSYFSEVQNVKEGIILKFKIENKKIKDVIIIPLDVNNNKVKFQPIILKGQQSQRVIKNLQSYSKAFYTLIQEKDDAGYINLNKPYEGVNINKTLLDYLSNYDTKKVIAHITHLSVNIGPRAQGSKQEDLAFKYIKKELESYGYAPEEQEFEIENQKKSHNIIAKKDFSSDANIIVIGAHVDSVPQAPGANDNASGCGVILEAARILKNAKIDKNVIFVFFGAEEGTANFSIANAFGSRYFVRKLKPEIVKKIIGMMSVDMAGSGKNFYIGNMQRGNAWFSAWMQFQGLQLGYPVFSFNAGVGSDHSAFEMLGIPVAYLEWYKDTNYHTSEDTVDKLQIQNLEITGQVIIASILNL